VNIKTDRKRIHEWAIRSSGDGSMLMEKGEEENLRREYWGLLSSNESLGGCTKFWRNPHTNPTKIGEDRATHYKEYMVASSKKRNRICSSSK